MQVKSYIKPNISEFKIDNEITLVSLSPVNKPVLPPVPGSTTTEGAGLYSTKPESFDHDPFKTEEFK